MPEFENDFESLFERINDAYANHFIDGDDLDRISTTMNLLYIDESRQIAIANGDMDANDEDVPLFAETQDLFRQTQNKQVFIADLDVVFHQIKKFEGVGELADFVRKCR